ncbi:hypothetical protein ACF0H5_019345 [Mactra antiquata]
MVSYNLADSHEDGSNNFVEIALDDNSAGSSSMIKLTKRKVLISLTAIGIVILCLLIGIGVLATAKNNLTGKVKELKAELQNKHSQSSTSFKTTPTASTSVNTSPTASVKPVSTTPSSGSSANPDIVTTEESGWTKTLNALKVNQNLEFSISNTNKANVKWTHDLAVNPGDIQDCSNNSATNICLDLAGSVRLTVTIATEALTNGSVECYDMQWNALKDVDQTLSDCFDTTDTHWYGGYEDTNQYWPFEKNTMPLTPYVTHDAFVSAPGNVMDRYFVSSKGVGILIDNDVPLYFSLNNPTKGKMCLTSKYEHSPYFNTDGLLPSLKYKICRSSDVLAIHKEMSEAFIPRPTGIPNDTLFKYPIWSTWAQYHKDINQTTVIEFTNDIMNNKFTCSQIEIDDNWTPYYGDLVFDSTKFPDVNEMVYHITNSTGCTVSVWVHPFFNSDSLSFQIAENKSFLIRNVSSEAHAALTKWWDGTSAGLLDVSNPEAVEWYLETLETLKNSTGIDSFKFDAGESSWLPALYNASNLPHNPNDNYPKHYVEMAAQTDPYHRQEVRGGYKTQHLPLFVRQIDKLSTWDHRNGLESIIPGVFTFGLLGYPFVLPDMIGGNAYDGRFPSAELFVRWIQLNTFLPAMQYSIVPWDPRFNDSDIDVVSISRKFTELHANISNQLIEIASESIANGCPIIRPLWWMAPMDEMALTCEDEFLVGDYYLVAPVLKPGVTSRDIYFPKGRWCDELRQNGTYYTGPNIVTNYTVDIDELAYFTNMDSGLSSC